MNNLINKKQVNSVFHLKQGNPIPINQIKQIRGPALTHPTFRQNEVKAAYTEGDDGTN